MKPVLLTRRTYLTMAVLAEHEERGSILNVVLAMEAVASTAIEHPEWDMDEERTFAAWQHEYRVNRG